MSQPAIASSRDRWFARLVMAVFLCSIVVVALVDGSASEIKWLTDEVMIETSDGKRHRFTVEMALEDGQHARGLMFRETLAEDEGMLFIYGKPAPVSMWMKNTLIPLDMLFIDRKGRIVRIAENTTPLSEKSIHSGRPVVAVLEVPAGTAKRLQIKLGDQVVNERFLPHE